MLAEEKPAFNYNSWHDGMLFTLDAIIPQDEETKGKTGSCVRLAIDLIFTKRKILFNL